jgi:hypothetical protein
VSRDLYRAAVFFLMMPHFAARSTSEKVWGERRLGAIGILRRDQSPEGADLVTKARLPAAIDRRASFRDSDPLQCGNVIRHSKLTIQPY